MTNLNGTVVTDLDAHDDNDTLTAQGYTIRHVESWQRDGHEHSFIVWDAPEIGEADLPF